MSRSFWRASSSVWSISEICWPIPKQSLSAQTTPSSVEIRVIDCDLDLDLTPVERVSRMLGKGYLYGFHFLPHDALATQKSGRTFLNELKEAGLANCKAVPRTSGHLGRHQSPQTDAAALQLPAATLRTRNRNAFRLPYSARDIDRPCAG